MIGVGFRERRAVVVVVIVFVISAVRWRLESPGVKADVSNLEQSRDGISERSSRRERPTTKTNDRS